MKFKNNIESQAGIEDSAGSAGTDGKILSSLGVDINGVAGVGWIDQEDVVAGEADKAKSVILRVKNATASPMAKGQVICEAVSASPPNGNLIEVALADNNGTDKMPALGILNEDLDAAGGDNDEGDAIMFGKVSGIDTSLFSVGDQVFVSDVPGGLTITKPTGVKYIQKVGVVIRDDNTNGTIEVFGAGRVNDVPTPLYVDHTNQRLGIGTASPQEKLHIYQTTASAVRLEIESTQPADSIVKYTNSIRSYATFLTQSGQFSLYDYNAASHRLYMLTNGNIGIGTTNPGEKLTAAGNISVTSPNSFLVKNGDSNHGLKYGYNTFASNPTDGPILYGYDAGGLGTKRNSENIALYWNYLGNVGIGTTNPFSKLEVNGDTSNALLTL